MIQLHKKGEATAEKDAIKSKSASTILSDKVSAIGDRTTSQRSFGETNGIPVAQYQQIDMSKEEKKEGNKVSGASNLADHG